MFRRRNALLTAAAAYVDQGIAVRPAPALRPRTGRTGRVRPVELLVR